MNHDELANIITTESIEMAFDNMHVPPLFHGTNRAALYYSPDERVELFHACEIMIRYLLPIYNKIGFGSGNRYDKDLGDIYRLVKDTYVAASCREMNLSTYQYHSTYLTIEPRTATMYARRAIVLGETGYTAYWLHQGLMKIGVSMPECTQEEQDAFRLFYEYEQREEIDPMIHDNLNPVILMFCGLRKEYLLNEQGDEITDEGFNYMFQYMRGCFRTKNDFDLLKGKMLTVTEALGIYKYYNEHIEQLVNDYREEYQNMLNKGINEIKNTFTSDLNDVIEMDKE